MRKNGFTLIELLAVIVILAIIALIATPIILGIINDAREESQERSAELYLNGVELAIARRNLTEEFNPSTCTITDGVVTCEGYSEPLKVDVDGEVPESGTIRLEENKITIGTVIVFNTFNVEINAEGEIEVGPKEEINDGESNNGGETSKQVYKPQYYYFGFDFSGTVGETVAPANPSSVPPTGEIRYLGYDVEDGKVSAAYACFTRNDVEYCLIPNDFATSTEIIKDAYSVVLDTACSFDGGYATCTDDLLYVLADSNGTVFANGDYSECDVYSDGRFNCSEM